MQFYISISNGLLEGNHQDRMGTAVWQFMWLIDKVTTIDEDGTGWVLGKKAINLKDMTGNVTENTISRNLQRLEKEGYIQIQHNSYGMIIGVNKAKKRFAKNVEPDDKRFAKNGDEGSPKMAKLNYKNGDPSITITVDNNSKTITQATAEAVAEPTTNELIDLFRPINPTINFGNKTQRKAIETLISKIGSGKTKNAINYAVSIQGTKFSPTITTPIQLLNRYGELQAYYLKNNKINVARI